MSFLETFALPFSRSVNGKSYTIKLLSTGDYLEWMAELTTARRAAFRAEVPEGVDPASRFNINKAIALYEVTPDTLIELIATGPGTIRVLNMLGKKAGITDDAELAAFVNGGTPQQNLRDAYRGSALLTAEQYLSYFPDELPIEDTLVVLVRFAKLSPQSRIAMADALTNPAYGETQRRSALAAIVGLPDAPEKPDPNASNAPPAS